MTFIEKNNTKVIEMKFGRLSNQHGSGGTPRVVNSDSKGGGKAYQKVSGADEESGGHPSLSHQ